MNTLFDAPLSHTNDPETSRMAAEKLAKSGGWTAQQAEVYEALKLALKKYPKGATAGEVGVEMKGESILANRFRANRRLPELATLQLVERGPKRQCTFIGNLCVTWFVRETLSG